jgi:hypothetical protein
MQTQPLRCRTIKKISCDSFAHIDPQLIPSVGLCDDTFTKRFGDKTSIRLLCDFKNEFAHGRYYATCDHQCKGLLSHDR